MPKNRLRLIRLHVAVCFVAATAAGCYESAVPLDPSPHAAIDARLIGRWHCVSSDADDRDMTLAVSPSGPNEYGVTLQEFGQPADQYRAYASSLRESLVVNVRNVKSSSKPWVVVRYVLLQDDTARFDVVDAEKMKNIEVSSSSMLRRALERRFDDRALFMHACTCVRMYAK